MNHEAQSTHPQQNLLFEFNVSIWLVWDLLHAKNEACDVLF